MADSNLERITILLQARDKDLARSMDRMNRQIARFTRDSERNTARMQQRVESHFSQMGQSVLGFGRNLATGFAVGAATTALGVLTTNLRGTVRNIAAVGDEARRAGLGVEQFQEWAFVADQNRIAIDAVTDGFKELSLRADEFITTGGGSAAEAFTRLGFTATDLATRLQDPSELMLEIFDRMKNLDQAAQIRVFDEVLGGTGGERFVELLALGENGLRQQMARGRELGAVLDEEVVARAAEIDRKFGEITTTLANMGKEVVVSVASAIATVIGMADEMEAAFNERRDRIIGSAAGAAVDQTAGAAEEISASLDTLMGAYNEAGVQAMMAATRIEGFIDLLDGEKYDDVANSLQQMADRMRDLARGFVTGQIEGDAFRTGLEQTSEQAETTLENIEGINEVDLTNAIAVVNALKGVLAGLQGQAQQTAAAVQAATMTPARQVGSFWDTEEGRFSTLGRLAPTTSPRPREAPTLDSLTTGSSGGGGGRGSDGYRGAVEDIQARTRALELEAAALVAAAGSNQEYGAAIEYARVRAQLMNDATAEGRTITDELQAEIDALAQAYVTAGTNAEEAADRMRQVQEDAQRGADAIGSIFDAILQGGDAARNAIARLLQQMASSAFQRLLMGMTGSGGGGVLSVLGSLLGGKRAGGGGVMAGVPYQVNENTPNSEIFIPSRSGGVLNVAQAKDAMRGSMGSMDAHITVSVDQNGNLQAFIDRRADSRIQRAKPSLRQDAVAATRASVEEFPLR